MSCREPLTDRQWAARNLRDLQERLRSEMRGRFGYGDHVKATVRVTTTRRLMPQTAYLGERFYEIKTGPVTFRMRAHGCRFDRFETRMKLERIVDVQILIRSMVDEFYREMRRHGVPGLAAASPDRTGTPGV